MATATRRKSTMPPMANPVLYHVGELVRRLGDIPLDRIRMFPPPGTATEEDVIRALEGPGNRLCELIDGVLVEKPVGYTESILAALILQQLLNYLDNHDLGVAAGPDGTLHFKIGLVRIPDVSFIGWDRIPADGVPDEPIPHLIPHLAIEILSKSNTRKEMARKLTDYFEAGVQLAWLIDPRSQTATVYTSATKKQRLGKDGILEARSILPGFRLSLKQLFARASRRRPR